jgi:hypothetical protein
VRALRGRRHLRALAGALSWLAAVDNSAVGHPVCSRSERLVPELPADWMERVGRIGNFRAAADGEVKGTMAGDTHRAPRPQPPFP